ncbi:MAG: endonuclease/exonuclease/phosphatase family protein [Cyclobacteriaceae bacterium]
MQLVQILLYVIGYGIIAISLIPLIRHDNWIFRIFEYPRSQKLLINLSILLLFIILFNFESTHPIIFVVLLGGNSLYLFYQIFPYTKLAGKQMEVHHSPDISRQLKLMVCNVFQDNRDYQKVLQRIDECKPDIIILVETDLLWQSALKSLNKMYPYRVSKPLNNTYGILLFSKLDLIDPQVKFLIEPEIPSIHTKVKLPSGDIFHLYCIHPKPPVPQESPRSTERDAEILTIAKEAKACTLPVIVAGDLNDVAWSYTTELFLKVSGLLDPRRGRGFYSTFHAKYWFLRWPLDHVFCSKHFHLIKLKVLPSIGSDHFPIFLELVLPEEYLKAHEDKALEADAEDVQMAEEKINNAR